MVAAPARGSALRDLWAACEGELASAGGATYYLRRWKRRVEAGKVPCSPGGALVALRQDLGAARDDPAVWALLQPWAERLQAERERRSPNRLRTERNARLIRRRPH